MAANDIAFSVDVHYHTFTNTLLKYYMMMMMEQINIVLLLITCNCFCPVNRTSNMKVMNVHSTRFDIELLS